MGGIFADAAQTLLQFVYAGLKKSAGLSRAFLVPAAKAAGMQRT